MTTDSIIQKFNQMELLFRGIRWPSKKFDRNASRAVKAYPEEFTHARQEVRKTLRRPQAPTKARTKSKQYGKDGNQARSTSLIGPGTCVFTEVGFGVDLDKKQMISANRTTIVSGYGAKKNYLSVTRGLSEKIDPELEIIRKQMRLGHSSHYNEILIDIKDFPCVLFSSDNKPRRHINLLEAIHLRNAYQIESNNNALLRIYEFSGQTGDCREVMVTDDLVIAAFESYFFEKSFEKFSNPNHIKDVNEMVRDLITTDVIQNFMRVQGDSLMQGYETGLKSRILERLTALKQKHLDEILESVFPDAEYPETEIIPTLMRLNIQIKMGVPHRVFPRCLFDAIKKYFYSSTFSFDSRHAMPLFTQLAQHEPFRKPMKQMIGMVPFRDVESFSRLICILDPKGSGEQLKLQLKDMMEQSLLSYYDLTYLTMKNDWPALQANFIHDKIHANNRYYKQSLHEVISRMAFPNYPDKPLPTSTEFLLHYRPKVNLRQKQSLAEINLLRYHVDEFSSGMKDAQNIIHSALLLLFRNNMSVVGVDVILCMKNLITLCSRFTQHSPYSRHYEAMINRLFDELVQKTGSLESLSLEHQFTPYLQLDGLYCAIYGLKRYSHTQVAEIVSELILRVAKISIKLNWNDPEDSSKLHRGESIEQWLPRLGNFEFGSYYTQLMHHRLMHQLMPQFPLKLSQVYENLARETFYTTSADQIPNRKCKL